MSLFELLVDLRIPWLSSPQKMPTTLLWLVICRLLPQSFMLSLDLQLFAQKRYVISTLQIFSCCTAPCLFRTVHQILSSNTKLKIIFSKSHTATFYKNITLIKVASFASVYYHAACQGTKGLFQGPSASGPKRARTQISFYTMQPVINFLKQ